MNICPSKMRHAEIQRLAYQFWEERGSPVDSSEEDWFRAERELLQELGPSIGFSVDLSLTSPFSSMSMGPITE